jgi:hypothetical protein
MSILASLRQAAVALAVAAAEAEDTSKAFLEGIADKDGPTGSSTPFRARPRAHDHMTIRTSTSRQQPSFLFRNAF